MTQDVLTCARKRIVVDDKGRFVLVHERAQPVARIPDPPTGLDAQPDGANRIALSWAPQVPGTQFQIYRSTGTCATPGPAATDGVRQRVFPLLFFLAGLLALVIAMITVYLQGRRAALMNPTEALRYE